MRIGLIIVERNRWRGRNHLSTLCRGCCSDAAILPPQHSIFRLVIPSTTIASGERHCGRSSRSRHQHRRCVMTELRVQMDNAMLVRGMAERTRETYLAAVARLARH